LRVLLSVRVIPSDRTASAIQQHRRNPPLSKELLARQWGIGIDAAERTLTVTTQAGIRKLHNPVERQFCTKQSHLTFPTLPSRFYTDTFFSILPPFVLTHVPKLSQMDLAIHMFTL
jgi:hypothetical protein